MRASLFNIVLPPWRARTHTHTPTHILIHTFDWGHWGPCTQQSWRACAHPVSGQILCVCQSTCMPVNMSPPLIDRTLAGGAIAGAALISLLWVYTSAPPPLSLAISARAPVRTVVHRTPAPAPPPVPAFAGASGIHGLRQSTAMKAQAGPAPDRDPSPSLNADLRSGWVWSAAAAFVVATAAALVRMLRPAAQPVRAAPLVPVALEAAAQQGPIALYMAGGKKKKKGGKKKKGNKDQGLSGMAWAQSFEVAPADSTPLRALAETLVVMYKQRTGKTLDRSLDGSPNVPKALWAAPVAVIVVDEGEAAEGEDAAADAPADDGSEAADESAAEKPPAGRD